MNRGVPASILIGFLIVFAFLIVPPAAAHLTSCAPADFTDAVDLRRDTGANSAIDGTTGLNKLELRDGCVAETDTHVEVWVATTAAPAPAANQYHTYVLSFNVGGAARTITWAHSNGAAATSSGSGTAAVSGTGLEFRIPRTLATAGAPIDSLQIRSSGYFVTPQGTVLTADDRSPNNPHFPPVSPYIVGARAPPTLDTDGDGAPDRDEIANGTSPNGIDTDFDGLLDGASVDVPIGGPRAANFTAAGILQLSDDGTNLRFAGEAEFGTNATLPDTDGDGLLDGGNRTVPTGGNESVLFLQAGLQAVSSDGVSDTFLGEFGFGSNPANLDTDADGIRDRDEILGDRNPYKDYGYFTDLPGSTNPRSGDTDGDGLTDLEEILGEATAPDGTALVFSPTNPVVADTDGDGLSDRDELLGTAANSRGEPVTFPPTDPTSADSDGDGATDQGEVEAGSDPRDPNSKPGARGEDEGVQEAELSYFFLSTVALLVVGLLSVIGILVRWG